MIKCLKAKDRSMVARMAGNIIGPAFVEGVKDFVRRSEYELPEDFFRVQAQNAVIMAMAIVEEVDRQIEEHQESGNETS